MMPPSLRDIRLRDMLAAVEEWRRASGEDRRYWRGRAQLALADFRHFHLDPEAAAFRAAVARIRMRRAA
jgi:hypothetical protein